MNASGYFPTAAEFARRRERWAKLGAWRGVEPRISIVRCRQGWSTLQLDHSIINTPLTLGGQVFSTGFGTHPDSEIVFHSSMKLKHFHAVVGLDENPDTVCATCELRFSVTSGDRVLWKSEPVRRGAPVEIDIPLNGDCRDLTLCVSTDTLYLAHADWCDAKVTTADGAEVVLSAVSNALDCDLLPLSFHYGGTPSDELLPRWQWTEQQEKHDGFHRRIISVANPEDQFTVLFTLDEYDELPISLWRVSFVNGGDKPSRSLNAVRSIDLALPRSDMRYARGSFYYIESGGGGSPYRDNFKLERLSAQSEEPLQMKGEAGRPSVDFMPFVNAASSDGGIVLGIGWTGQWMAEIVPGYPQCTRILAGMEFLDTYLEPGEAITQPSALLVDYEGCDFERGQNLLRRFLATIWIPETMRQLPVSFTTWGSLPQEAHLANVALLEKQKLDVDCYWIDAGWYGRSEDNNGDDGTLWIRNTGNWNINSSIYPQGLRAVADAVHAFGRKFLVWFEPERAYAGSDITQEHPEYFYDFELGGNRILNLGNPKAEQWMLDFISGMIIAQGIDCYRQDFNTAPLAAWRKNDAPNRIGISEIRHVEALYRIFDALLERHPGLLIDNCASGGRRLDFEMMHRSVPLWASDMMCFPDFDCEEAQSLTAGLNAWLPCFGFGTQYRPGDTYHFRSVLASGMAFGAWQDASMPEDYPYDWHRKMLADFHHARPFMSGDYYELTAQSLSRRQWQALQFDRPDLHGGCVVVLRRSESPFKVAEFALRGLDSDALYEIEDADSGALRTLTGRNLMEVGLEVELSTRRSSALLFYRNIHEL